MVLKPVCYILFSIVTGPHLSGRGQMRCGFVFVFFILCGAADEPAAGWKGVLPGHRHSGRMV